MARHCSRREQLVFRRRRRRLCRRRLCRLWCRARTRNTKESFKLKIKNTRKERKKERKQRANVPLFPSSSRSLREEIDFLDEIKQKMKKFVAGGEFEGTFLKPKFGDASGVRGAARLARTTNY